MAHKVPMDPTKMGVGRAIAVLTSGGDAQGEWRGAFETLFSKHLKHFKVSDTGNDLVFAFDTCFTSISDTCKTIRKAKS